MFAFIAPTWVFLPFFGDVVEKSLEPGLEELLRDGGGCLTNLDYIPEGAASNDKRNEKKTPGDVWVVRVVGLTFQRKRC